MTQLELTAPISRWSDPSSSHFAAADMIDSPRRDSECRMILGALKYAGKPASYREVHSLLDGKIREAVEVQRRLSDLRHAGLVKNGTQRKCSISGRPAQTWEAA